MRKAVIAGIGLIVAGFLFLAFFKPQKIDFQVVKVDSDTTFENPIWRDPGGSGMPISLRATGELDNPAEVFVQDPQFSDKFLATQLPKGQFDTTWKGEYYERTANVVFRHKEATKGHIKLTFRYLTANGDTISSYNK